ncbi:GAF domain-containing sensor histidine kinase, partial [Bacteroidota bacterium]
IKDPVDKDETSPKDLLDIAAKRKHLEDKVMTAEKLEMINKAAQLVNSNIKIDDVLKTIVDVASNLTKADRGTLYLLDKESDELWSKVAMGNEMREIRVKIGEGISGWVAKSGEVVNIEDVKTDKRFKSDFDKSSGYETKNMLCYPIKNKKEEVVGVLQLLNSASGKFSELDHEFLNALSIHAALALENAELVEKLLHGERISSLGKMANFLIQDIKKPILVSKRYAEHLKSKELTPEITQVIDMMLDQLNQVTDLVQTTSSYSEGKRILHTLSVNFKETMEDFAERITSYIQARNCDIINNVDLDTNLKLDVKEFYQCYMHIIRNACDAMPDGGRIIISAVLHDNNTLTISFQDDGLGIPDSIVDKVFEPFTSHGKKEGTGLGLSITKQIVEAHGGEIFIVSAIGEGTTVNIKLPVNE